MGKESALGSFIEELKSGSEFKRLKSAKDAISKNPGLKKDFEEFCTEQNRIFSSRAGLKETGEKLKQLNSKFESLSKIPEIKNYLEALSAFNKIMEKNNSMIGESIEKGLQ